MNEINKCQRKEDNHEKISIIHEGKSFLKRKNEMAWYQNFSTIFNQIISEAENIKDSSNEWRMRWINESNSERWVLCSI